MLEAINSSWKMLSEKAQSFLYFFCFQTVIQLINPYSEYLGVTQSSPEFIVIQLFVVLLAVLNSTYVIHLTLSLKNSQDRSHKELMKDGLYDSPTYFLYSLLYGLTILGGAFLLLFPALYFLVFHYFTPLIAVIDPDANSGDESYFSYSRRLVRQELGQTILFFLVFLILTGLVSLFCYLPPFAGVRLYLEIGLSPLEAALVLFCEVMTIEFYYFLKDSGDLEVEKAL